MTCPCDKPQTVALIDGATCCTWCERHARECEACFVLALPTKLHRRAYLDGDGTPRRKGVRGMRGDAAVTALEQLARAIWETKKCSQE